MASGALWGVTVWSAYGLVEMFFCAAWPLFMADLAIFRGPTWLITATIFNAYWIAGAVSGAVSGAVFAGLGKSGRLAFSRFPASFGLCLVLMANAAIDSPVPLASKVVIAVAGLLAAVILVALLRPGSGLAGWLEIHPLLFSLMILGPSWFSTDALGFMKAIIVKRLAIAGFAACLVLIALLMRPSASWSPSRHASVNLGLLVVLSSLCSMVSGTNRTPFHGSLPAAPDPKEGPVILVTWDTTRADHLSAYGYPQETTPNLERFAHVATRYTDATAAADWTLPSHGSLFTGVYPGWHQAHSHSVFPPVIRPLNPQIPTLASILSQKGYYTAAVVANNVFLVPEWGLNRGFNGFDVEAPVPVLPTYQHFYLRHGLRSILGEWFDADFDSVFRRAEDINRNTFKLMDDNSVRDRSFFLFLNYMDAHSPYAAPAGRKKTLSLWKVRDMQEQFYRRKQQIPASARDELVSRYDAGIRDQDQAFAELLEWLKRRNLYDRALIILTSDHGEAFGENGRIEHGVGVAQDQVHVPLFIKFPHQTAGAVVTTPVSHVDVLPTILDTLGYTIPSHVQGRSLRDPAALNGRTIYTESYCNHFFGKFDPTLDRTERAMRRGNLKLVLSTSGKDELYDLSADPDEARNLKTTSPDAPQLEAAFRDWIHTVPKAPIPRQNEQEMRRLKGLGYVR
jgi:arylsulfatase A-like enzyme